MEKQFQVLAINRKAEEAFVDVRVRGDMLGSLYKALIATSDKRKCWGSMRRLGYVFGAIGNFIFNNDIPSDPEMAQSIEDAVTEYENSLQQTV